MTDYGQVAQDYLARGWYCVPIRNGKRPKGTAWRQLRLAGKELTRAFAGARGLGILLGEASGWLVDVDLDCDEAVALADSFLPPTGLELGRGRRPRSHRLYRSPGCPHRSFGIRDGGKLVELRLSGHQMAPPSPHPSGDTYTWDAEGEAAEVPGDELLRACANLAVASLLAHTWPGEGGRHSHALAVAGWLLKAGVDEELVTRLIVEAAEAAGDEEAEQREACVATTLERLARDEPVLGASALEHLPLRECERWLGLKRGRTSKPIPDDGICIHGRTGGALLAEASAALCASAGEQGLYRFGGRLAWVRAGAPVVLHRESSRVAVTAAARWYDGRGNVVTWAPQAVVDALHHDPPHALPELRGVTRVPVFSASGRLVTDPGYDEETKLWYEPSCEVLAAKPGYVAKALAEFPWADAASRANALAALVLPFVRAIVQGPAPLHLFTSTTPGTGKTLLAQTIGGIVGSCSLTSWPTLEEERRKTFSALLRAGERFVVLDNLPSERRVNSVALAALLSSWPTWSARRLGHTRNDAYPCETTWVATGNGVSATGELARRCVRVHLDTELQRPWLRTGFAIPMLRGWVEAHRGQLIAEVLSWVQAWVDAGAPAGAQAPMGTFERWSMVIGGILAHAGVEGFLANAADAYEDVDDSSAEWEQFCDLWWQEWKRQPKHASDLYDLATRMNLLAGEREGGNERSSRIRFGRALGARRGCVFGRWRIVRDKNDPRNRTGIYRLEELGGGDGERPDLGSGASVSRNGDIHPPNNQGSDAVGKSCPTPNAPGPAPGFEPDAPAPAPGFDAKVGKNARLLPDVPDVCLMSDSPHQAHLTEATAQVTESTTDVRMSFGQEGDFASDVHSQKTRIGEMVLVTPPTSATLDVNPSDSSLLSASDVRSTTSSHQHTAENSAPRPRDVHPPPTPPYNVDDDPFVASTLPGGIIKPGRVRTPCPPYIPDVGPPPEKGAPLEEWERWACALDGEVPGEWVPPERTHVPEPKYYEGPTVWGDKCILEILCPVCDLWGPVAIARYGPLVVGPEWPRGVYVYHESCLFGAGESKLGFTRQPGRCRRRRVDWVCD